MADIHTYIYVYMYIYMYKYKFTYAHKRKSLCWSYMQGVDVVGLVDFADFIFGDEAVKDSLFGRDRVSSHFVY